MLLQRHTTKEQQSNPTIFLLMVLQSLNEYKTGSFHVKTIVEHAVDWLILQNHLPKKGCHKLKFLEALLEELEADGFSPDALVSDGDKLIQHLHNHLTDLYAVRVSSNSLAAFRLYLRRQFITYNPRYDKACIIVDRDPKTTRKVSAKISMIMCSIFAVNRKSRSISQTPVLSSGCCCIFRLFSNSISKIC